MGNRKASKIDIFDTQSHSGSLFAEPNGFEKWFPPVKRDIEGFLKTLDEIDKEGGLDFEFPPTYKASIIGISSLQSCAAIQATPQLVMQVVGTFREKKARIVGHSVIGAEKRVIKETCGLDTSIDEYEDSMLSHYLLNADLAKAPDKGEKDDAGALGFMGLWTATSLVLQWPQWKECRDEDCEYVICPKHEVKGYCLRGETRVYLADGSTMRIADIVENKIRAKVLCVDDNGNITEEWITNWFKNPRANRKFLKVSYVGIEQPQWGTVMTADHKVLTKRGFVEASKLLPTDSINTGTPDLTTDQLSVFCGLLLGDMGRARNTFTLCHGEAQYEYLGYKKDILKPFVSNEQEYITPKGNKYKHVGLKVFPVFRTIPKDRTEEWWSFVEKNFTKYSLAVWYLDDGSYHKYQMSISCRRFTDDERNRIAKIIIKNTGIIVDASKKGKLVFHTDNAKKLSSVVSIIAPNCLRYKLHPHATNYDFDSDFWFTEEEQPSFYSLVLVEEAKERSNNLDDTVHCIEVNKYNNFLTVGGIVHNCAIDAAASLLTFQKHKEEFKKWNVPDKLYQELKELTYIAELMQQKGTKVDMPFVRKLEAKADEYKEQLFKDKNLFNPRAPQQVLEWFAKRGVKLEANTKKEVQKTLEKQAEKYGYQVRDEDGKFTLDALATEEDLPETLDALYRQYEYKDAGKGLDPWFADKYRDKEDILHPRFITIGASTSRWSSSRPNWTNTPARGFGSLVRAAIIPRDPTLDLLYTDASNLELRVCTYLAGIDPVILGKDPFTWLVQKSEGTLEKVATSIGWEPRQLAKSIAHGSGYGEGIKILYSRDLDKPYIKKEIEYGALRVYKDWEYCGGVVAFTGANLAERLFGSKSQEHRKQALAILEDIYFKQMYFIRDWQKKVLREIEDNGFIRYPTGHFLRLYGPAAENAKMGLAAYGQGVGAHHIQGLLLRFVRETGNIPIMFVHDSFTFEIPSSWSDSQCKEFISLMGMETDRLPGFSTPYKSYRGKNGLEFNPKNPIPGALVQL